MSNIALRPLENASSFRLLAPVIWGRPTDPTIYGTLVVRAEPLLAWLEQKRAAGGPRLTITHAVARALALALRAHPDMNGLIRWGRLDLREDVDIFLQVLLEPEPGSGIAKADLSGLVIRKADTKGLEQIAQELREGAQKLRTGQDKDFQSSKGLAQRLPASLMRRLLGLIDLCQYELNMDLRWAGLPRDPFGSAMVTSVGMMGIQMAWAPFFPLSRAPILLLVGAVEEAVVAENGQPVVARVFRLNATLDHRVIDGFHAGVLSKHIQGLLERPEGLEPA